MSSVRQPLDRGSSKVWKLRCLRATNPSPPFACVALEGQPLKLQVFNFFQPLLEVDASVMESFKRPPGAPYGPKQL